MSISSVNLYECLGNRTHIVAACPKCDTGCLLATADSSYSGIIQQRCNDCNDDSAFYVVIPELKAWLLAEPLKMKKVIEREEVEPHSVAARR